MQNESRLPLIRNVAIALAALGCSFPASGAQVTWEFIGEIGNISNQDRNPPTRPDWPPAVDPVSIPFAVGDPVRLLVTYESSSPATEFEGPCFIGGTGVSRFFSDPITGGAFSVGKVLGSITGSFFNDIQVLDCGGENLIVFQGNAAAPPIEDLVVVSFAAQYSTSAGCFTAGVPLPTGVPDPVTCPPRVSGVQSFIAVRWHDESHRRFVNANMSGVLAVVVPTSEASTPIGIEVTAQPVVTLPGGGAPVYVHLTFDEVTSEGTTTVTATSEASGGAEIPPPSFKVGDPPIYYDVQTTASFAGSVNLCFPWQEGQFDFEEGLALYHFENGAWQDVTTSLDTDANIVCGQASSLSPFAVFARDYTFLGFYQPVDNLPTRNRSKSGQAIPVKFSLNGNQGLSILAAGYPHSQSISCTSGAVSDPVEETVTASASGLKYDAAADVYTYVWKTEKSWAQSCRRLTLKLNDGSVRSADFEFTK